jgi:hypothetical protein
VFYGTNFLIYTLIHLARGRAAVLSLVVTVGVFWTYKEDENLIEMLASI